MFFPDFSEAVVATVKSAKRTEPPSLALVATSTLATALEMQLGKLAEKLCGWLAGTRAVGAEWAAEKVEAVRV